MTPDQTQQQTAEVIALWQCAVPVHDIARRLRLPARLVRQIIDQHQAANK